MAPPTSAPTTRAQARAAVSHPPAWFQDARHWWRLSRTNPRHEWLHQPVAVWLMVVGLCCTIFSGNSQYMGLPLSPDRVLIPIAIALALLDPTFPRIRWRPVHGLMLLLLVWTVFSMVIHRTVTNTFAIFALADRLAIPFLLLTAAPLIFSTAARRRLLLWAVALVGIYLGCTAVFEVIGPHKFVFPRYIMNPHLGILFGRARGPFLGSEAMGMSLVIGAMATGILAATSRGWHRWLLVGAMLPMLAGIVLTMTRSIWVSAVLALLVVAWFVRASRPYLFAAAGALAGVGAVALASMPSLAESLIERLTTQRSIFDRQNTNDAALRIMWDRPWDGIGWMEFLREGKHWVRQSDEYPITNVVIEVHNVFLSRAAELGIPAAIVFGLCVWFGPISALRRRGGLTMPSAPDLDQWRLFGAVALCAWIMPTLFSPNPYPFPNFLMWSICGIGGLTVMVRPPLYLPALDAEGAARLGHSPST